MKRTFWLLIVIVLLIAAGCATVQTELNDPAAYIKRGNAYWSEGQYDQAISDYNKALEINPRHAKAYYNRGNTYMSTGQYDQAISDFTKALEINPRYAKAYNNRANTYKSIGQYDKAWEDVDKAQDLSYKINPRFLKNLREASGRQK